MGSKRNGEGLKSVGNTSNPRTSKTLKHLDPGVSGVGIENGHQHVRGEKSETFEGAYEAGKRTEEYGEENASTGWFSDDTLMQVMSFFSTCQLLSRLAFVCRRWRRLSKGMVSQLLPPHLESPTPWGPWAPRYLFLELVDRYKLTVEKIELCGLSWMTIEDVAHIISSLPRLKHLTITSLQTCGLFPKPAALVSMARILPQQLLSLDLHLDPSLRAMYLESESLTVNNDFFVELQQRCSRLQKLNLDGYILTWEGLDGLLQACPTLTFLDAQSERLGWSEVHTILNRCTSLVHLSVVSPLLDEDVGPADQTWTGPQGGRRLMVRSREGARCAEAELHDVVIVPPRLSSLRLYSSSHRSVKLETAPALGLLRTLGHQLRHLHAQGLYNSSWQTISVWCQNLVSLDLSHRKERGLELTEIEVIVLRGLVKLLRRLEKLALPSATDSILGELGRCCPKLEELRFQGHYVNGREIHPRPDVTNPGIMQLTEGCPGLRVLSLAGCQNVTVSSARSLAFHCKGLQALYFSGCRNFTDVGVKALLPLMGNSLAVLDLVGCLMLTPAIFTSIMEAAEKHGSALRVLALSESLFRVYVRGHLSREFLRKLPLLRVVRGVSIDCRHVACWDGFYNRRYL